MFLFSGGHAQDSTENDTHSMTVELTVPPELQLQSLHNQVLNPSLGHRVPEITSVEWTERDEALLTGPKNRNKRSLSPSLNEFTLEWQTWTGSLPNGAVSIYNGYVKRYYFVCKYKCEAGFYNPYMGNYCHYPYADKEHLDSQFDILVNKDNFEFTEWKEGSYGSVPPYSVKTCSDRDKYVAKNQYGLGKMQVMHEAFFLPWVDKEYWYKTYQVLTVNRDIFSEQITDVKYKIDGAENIKYPPEIVKTSSLINYECREVTRTATLTKEIRTEQRWDTSFSFTVQFSIQFNFIYIAPIHNKVISGHFTE
ncbi:natterin-3-like [Channa argus]|uniref:natterin-3-like n=1 Tax=Channa argus TaxID=215402 RepID=UPI003520D131